jgi:hypothetical protein
MKNKEIHMHVQRAAVLLLLWGSICKGQQMTHEEVVRTTYARLAFASQVNEAHNMLSETREKGRKEIDRGDFQRRMQFGTLKFELSNFKVGPVSEIAKVKYSDLVTKPSSASGDSLDVGSGHLTFSRNGTEMQSAIASARWIRSRDISEDWNVPFAEAIAQGEWAGLHQRYASFSIHVTFQGRSRDYRAMFLSVRRPTAGRLSLPSTRLSTSTAARCIVFVDDDAYPATLLEGGLGEDSAIRE